MKKLIGLMLAAGMLLGCLGVSPAGDREWATAGKILAGAVGVAVLADALDNGYRRSEPAGYYAAPPRPVYYETRYVNAYPSANYYGGGYSRTEYYGAPRPYYSYYEEETVEPVTYERRTVTRTY